MKKILSICGLLLMASWCEQSLALQRTDTVAVGNLETQKLAPQTLFMERDSGITLDEAKQLFVSEGYTQDADTPIFGFTDQTIWGKIILKNISARLFKGVLLIAPSLTDSVYLYKVRDDSLLGTQFTGTSFAFDERKIAHPDNYFPVELAPSEHITLYLKVKSRSALLLPLTLHSEQAYLKSKTQSNLIYGFLAGVFFFAILYHFFIYIVVRDRSYLYYIAYLLLFFLVLSVLNGYAFQYIYPDTPGISPFLHRLFMHLSGIAFILMATSILHTKKWTPFYHNLLYIMVGLHALGVLLLPLGFLNLSSQLTFGSLFITAPLILYIAVKVYRDGFKPAKYFLLSRTLVIIGLVINFLTALEFFAYHEFWTKAFIWAYVVEAILMSLALADRIKTLTLETEKQKRKRISEKMRAEAAELQARAAEMQARAVEQENARKTDELERARKIQLSMLPTFPPFMDHFDTAIYMKTATEVGGDYYDFFTQPDGSVIAALGDASGHGMPAGIMVTLTKAGLTFGDKSDLTRLMHHLNNNLKELRPHRLNMALSLLHLSKDGLKYISAAMPPLLHYHGSSGELTELMRPALPLGTFENTSYREQAVHGVLPGDVLVITSDGLIEATNPDGEQYGYDRYQEVVKAVAGYNSSAEDIIDAMLDDLRDFTQTDEFSDDVTLFVVKRKKTEQK